MDTAGRRTGRASVPARPGGQRLEPQGPGGCRRDQLDGKRPSSWENASGGQTASERPVHSSLIDKAARIVPPQGECKFTFSVFPEAVGRTGHMIIETKWNERRRPGKTGDQPGCACSAWNRLIGIWKVGTRVVRSGLHDLVDRTDRRDLSIFQIGLHFVERCLTNALAFRIPLCSFR